MAQLSYRATVVLIVFTLLSALSGCFHVVRPVTLQVVEAETKQPISGMKVLYVLTEKYTIEEVSNVPKRFEGRTRLAPPMDKASQTLHVTGHLVGDLLEWPADVGASILASEEYATDEQGYVRIKRRIVFLNGRINSEMVFVNVSAEIDRLTDAYFNNGRYYPFIRCEPPLFAIADPSYKGFRLVYTPREWDHDERLRTDHRYKINYDPWSDDRCDSLQRPADWRQPGPAEEFIVELRRRK
jgi:hypothetical protein